MSKELEAFGLVKRTCELYIQSKTYLIGSDIIKNQINEALDTIKNRLEAIEKGKNTDIIDNYMAFKNDNAEPSEVLKCLDKLFNDYKELCEDTGSNEHIYQECNLTSPYNTIKKFITKAQEPKRYLKWDDIEFKDFQQEIKVKLGNLTYSVWYVLEHGDPCVELTRNQQQVITLYSSYPEDILFFNDLHLEVVEE